MDSPDATVKERKQVRFDLNIEIFFIPNKWGEMSKRVLDKDRVGDEKERRLGKEPETKIKASFADKTKTDTIFAGSNAKETRKTIEKAKRLRKVKRIKFIEDKTDNQSSQSSVEDEEEEHVTSDEVKTPQEEFDNKTNKKPILTPASLMRLYSSKGDKPRQSCCAQNNNKEARPSTAPDINSTSQEDIASCEKSQDTLRPFTVPVTNYRLRLPALPSICSSGGDTLRSRSHKKEVEILRNYQLRNYSQMQAGALSKRGLNRTGLFVPTRRYFLSGLENRQSDAPKRINLEKCSNTPEGRLKDIVDKLSQSSKNPAWKKLLHSEYLVKECLTASSIKLNQSTFR